MTFKERAYKMLLQKENDLLFRVFEKQGNNSFGGEV